MSTDEDLPITGSRGELVDRLIAAIDSEQDPNWIGAFEVAAGASLRGSLRDITIDRGPVPEGSVAKVLWGDSDRVSRSEYLAVVRDRLLEIVDADVSEAFIVTAIWQTFRDHLASLADPAVGEASRMKLRERLLDEVDDPAVSESRREMADTMLSGPVLQPTGPVTREIAERLAAAAAELEKTLVSAEALRHWLVDAAARTRGLQ